MIWLLACTGAEPTGPPSLAPGPPQAQGQVQGPRRPGPQAKGFHAQVEMDLVREIPRWGPSIVIISLDTVNAETLALYGGVAQTPNIAKLAERGVLVEQAISHFPETCLSHWSMLSGVLPEVHGNAPLNQGSIYTGPTLVEIAGSAGYRSGAIIGGITLQDQACGLGRAFDHYDDRVPNNPLDFTRPAEQVTKNAVSWIQQRSGPYVAFVHYFDAHFPYTPRPEYAAMYATGYAGGLSGSDVDLKPFRDGGQTPSAEELAHIHSLYAAEITQLDAALGPLLDSLDLNNTIVVITSDHGESFGHDYWFNHREGLWDQVIHVPLIIAGRGFESGVRVSEQVGLIDLAPTVLAAAGLPADSGMQGTDFRERGQAVEVTSITDPWREQSSMAVRSETLKVMFTPTRQLAYDLVLDPQELAPIEMTNLDEHTQIYGQILKRYAPRQVAAPKAPALSPERQEQLKSLGYIAPE